MALNKRGVNSGGRQEMKEMNLKTVKIGVIGGGVSSEREISLISSEEVCKALRRKKIEEVFIDLRTSQEDEAKQQLSSYNIDVAFIAMHGEFGEDGRLQKILEDMGVPYTGSPPAASYLAMNKIASKAIFSKADILTPPFCSGTKRDFAAHKEYGIFKKLPKGTTYPLVVKPFFSGSSIGVFIVKNNSELTKALHKVFSLQDEAVVESYIAGRELTVGILEEEPLAIIEIISKNEYFDFNAKYKEGEAELKIAADLSDDIRRRVKQAALGAHRALGCRHFSRVDIRLSREGLPYVLEVNSIPGLTSHSLLPLSAEGCGISFDELIERMVYLALKDKYCDVLSLPAYS